MGLASSRRKLLAFGAALALSTALTRPSGGEEPPLPVARQAELLVRVTPYDRNFAARAAGKATVLVVTNEGDADSRATAAAMESALRRFERIGETPIEVAHVSYTSAESLSAACRSAHASIVYLTPGLDGAIADLVRALDGADVLTVSAIPRFVASGVVLGFDLVSAKPTLLFNLTQARRQNVAMDPSAVRLMQVIK